MALPYYEFRYDQRRMYLSAIGPAAFALILGIGAIQYWALALAALAAAGLAVYTVVTANDRGIILSIGPDGLLYKPFSDKHIPWSDIMGVTVVRGTSRQVTWGKRSDVPNPMMDKIALSLRSFEKYSGELRNSLRGLKRFFGRAGLEFDVWHLQNAPADKVADAISYYWQGQIQDVTLANGVPVSKAWNNSKQ